MSNELQSSTMQRLADRVGQPRSSLLTLTIDVPELRPIAILMPAPDLGCCLSVATSIKSRSMLPRNRRKVRGIHLAVRRTLCRRRAAVSHMLMGCAMQSPSHSVHGNERMRHRESRIAGEG